MDCRPDYDDPAYYDDNDELTVSINNLWSPLIGLSASEMERWELEGENTL